MDDQIYKTFADCGLTTKAQCQADSLKNLRQLLTEDHRFVFTMIQKFQVLRERQEDGTTVALEDKFPELSQRDDIIVITDEAHRSQYDTLALNMRKAMPKASFIGFTGTPLMGDEERTRDVFGDYVSIYNFKQSIDDGATVPLFYENRIPELQLTNEQFSEDMEAILDAAMLDEAQERKLERHFGREYHLITRSDRLDTIAKDLVAHFLGRGHLGKAMMVCIDRFTAVRMYDKVKAEWTEARKQLEYERMRTTPGTDEERDVLQRMAFMDETDMAVVISSSQNEQADFAEKGLKILPHRQRMVKEDLETRFKDEDDPLRLVFL